MDGFQVIEAIQELNPEAVVIAQTAYALANENTQSLEPDSMAISPNP